MSRQRGKWGIINQIKETCGEIKVTQEVLEEIDCMKKQI
jgi:hypothetical protein